MGGVTIASKQKQTNKYQFWIFFTNVFNNWPARRQGDTSWGRSFSACLQISPTSHRLWRCLPHKTCSGERRTPSWCVMKIEPILAQISYKGERAPPPKEKKRRRRRKNVGSIAPLCYRNSNLVTGKSRGALIKALGDRHVCEEGPEPRRGQPQRSHAQIPV